MGVMFWRKVASLLEGGCGVIATVIETAGSAPRKAGARLFLAADGSTIGTVGGGAAEGAALDVCRKLLHDGGPDREIHVDLTGNPGDLRDGVCGGTMRILATPLGQNHLPVIRSLLGELEAGKSASLLTGGRAGISLDGCDDARKDAWSEFVQPPDFLLVAGAGHIGRVLADWAATCGFVVGLQDSRQDYLDGTDQANLAWKEADATRAVSRLHMWSGRRFAVLVTRGYLADLEILRPLLPVAHELLFLGILGSRRRLATLRQECKKEGLPDWPGGITRAPVGLPIGGESPGEIAISILAQLVETRQCQTR